MERESKRDYNRWNNMLNSAYLVNKKSFGLLALTNENFDFNLRKRSFSPEAEFMAFQLPCGKIPVLPIRRPNP